MATITGYTKSKMDTINNTTVVGGTINGSGHLILSRRDGVTIDAGSVIGPTGPMGGLDPGDIVASIRTSKSGYLLLGGQAVLSANTLYPALWAVVPAAWKDANGTTLNLPNMADTVLQGDGAATAVADITGANTKTLLEANLPPHTHTGPSHVHTGGIHTHGMPHTHTMLHTHEHSHTHADTFAASASVTSAVRANSTAGATNSFMSASTTGTSDTTSVNPFVGVSITGSVGLPSEATTSGASVASTGGSSDPSTDSGGNVATTASGTAPTGPGNGTSSALDVQQKAMRVNYFIKT